MSVNLRDLLSPYKFVPIYMHRKDLNRDELGPHSVEFHWTSACNYSCIHCAYGNRRAVRQCLDNDTIRKVIQDLIDMKVKSVYFSGGGEPTFIPGWESHAEALLDHNIEVALITNGGVLNDGHATLLGRLNYVAVSVYSDREEIYRNITKGRFFEKQFSIPGIIRSKSSETVVGARCVLNSLNYEGIVPMYKKIMASGYDYLIFIPAIDYENKSIDLKPDEVAAVKEIVKDNYGLFDFEKTNIDSVLKRNIAHYDGTQYLDDPSAKQQKCLAIEIRGNVFINYDGGIYLCQPHIKNPEFCIGNVNDEAFCDIWNSARHKAVIDKLNERYAYGRCRNCRSLSFNKVAGEVETMKSEAFKMIKDNFI